MSASTGLSAQTDEELRKKYYKLLELILGVWSSVNPDEGLTQKEQKELEELESIAIRYVREMKNRGIHLPEWLGQ